MKSYADKLLSPKWQKKRLEILNRDGFKCALCSDEETTLHIHHKSYKSGCEPWEYDNSNLITLCKECHECVELERQSNVQEFPIKSYKSKTSPSIVFYYSNWISSFWLYLDKYKFHASMTNELILLLAKEINNG